jgi:hypothetical protein
VVSFREAESDPLREIDPNSTVDVAAAANIVVRDPGRAELTWAGFLDSQLLAGADILLSVVEPDARRLMVDQAAGTARYRLSGADEADFTVLANWVQASVSTGPADLIVSFVPADATTSRAATSWIVAVRGEATLSMYPDDGRPAVTLSEGFALGVPSGGPVTPPMAVDLPAVETWLASVAAGTAETSIARVAMVCEVTAAADLLTAAEAGADATEHSVASGDMVMVLDRNADASWALVHAAARDDSEAGWIAAGSLSCNAALAALPQADSGLVEEEPTATTAGPVATRPVVVITATAPPVTLTPTATVTGAPAVIEFWVDDNEIDAGECTNLHWRTSNIDSVYLDGRGVTGEGAQEVCPSRTTSYTLRVRKRDGNEESRTVEVEVNAAEPPAPTLPAATATDAPPIELPTATNEPPPQPTTTP